MAAIANFIALPKMTLQSSMQVSGLPSPAQTDKADSYIHKVVDNTPSALISPPISPLRVKVNAKFLPHLNTLSPNSQTKFSQLSSPSSPVSIRSHRSNHSIRSNSTSIFERDVELPCPTHNGARGAREAMDLSVPNILAGAVEALYNMDNSELLVETAIPFSMSPHKNSNSLITKSTNNLSPTRLTHTPSPISPVRPLRNSLSMLSLRPIMSLQDVGEDEYLPLVDPADSDTLTNMASLQSASRQSSQNCNFNKNSNLDSAKRRLSFVSHADLIMERPTVSQSFDLNDPNSILLDSNETGIKSRPLSRLSMLSNSDLRRSFLLESQSPQKASFLENCLQEMKETVTERGAKRLSSKLTTE